MVFLAAGCAGRSATRNGSETSGGGGQSSIGDTWSGGGGPLPSAGRTSDVDADFGGGSGGSDDPEPGPASDGGATSDDVPRCVPGQTIACACATGLQGTQSCADDGRYGSCVCQEGTLAWFRSKLVGKWGGTRTTPWDDPMAGPVSVMLEFRADGTWLGSCDSDNCLIFDNGSLETSLNRYHLTSSNEDRVAFGRLSVTWTRAYSTEGDLREIRFEANETELFFEFWATWSGEYGPISFALHSSSP